MLVVQSFLNRNQDYTNYPVPDNQGFIAFGYTENGMSECEFVHYKWENTKGHPSYYYFRFFKKNQQNIWRNMVQYQNWSSFFSQMNEIKRKIRNSDRNFVAKNYQEANQMLWKTYIRTQDQSLATLISNLPECFYDSIDESLDIRMQVEARDKCVDFLKDKIYYLYHSWKNFIDIDVKINFSSWFHNYCYGDI